MKKKNFFIYFLFLSLLCSYCSNISEVEEDPGIKIDEEISIPLLPDSIISKGDELIISKVGEQFFNSYIKYDSEKSRYYEANAYCIEHPPNCAEFLLKPHYLLVYTFKIPEKDFVNEIIEFVTDTVGKVVPSRDQFGIPSCPNNDCWEHFPLIGKKEAITIARNNGFDKGLRDWLISFNFYAGDFNNYIWTISKRFINQNSNREEEL